MPEDLTQGCFVQARARQDLGIFSEFAQHYILININFYAGNYSIPLCILLLFIRAPAHSMRDNSCLFIINKNCLQCSVAVWCC